MHAVSLELKDTSRVTELYLLAVKNGLCEIYCSNTGLPIASFDATEMYNLIELELARFPLLSDDDFLDHLQLTMIPASSRPSAMFQNMTAKHYHAMSLRFPEHMFRFLAGRFVFERWSHIAGHTNHGGKTEWLKAIPLHNTDTKEFKEALEALIRIDAVFGLRRAFMSHELKATLKEIQQEWPGFEVFADFIHEMEMSNITRLSTMPHSEASKFSGNSMAQLSAILHAAKLPPEQITAAYLVEVEAERTRRMIRDNKKKDEMAKINQREAERNAMGNTTITRGANAFVSLAIAMSDVGGKIDNNYVAKALAEYDFNKSQYRTLRKIAEGGVVVKDDKRKTPKVKKAPKVVFDLDLTLTL